MVLNKCYVLFQETRDEKRDEFEQGEREDHREADGQSHVPPGEFFFLGLRGFVRGIIERPDADDHHLDKPEHAAEEGPLEEFVFVTQGFDSILLYANRTVRLADNDRDVVRGAHHDALDDRLAPCGDEFFRHE